MSQIQFGKCISSTVNGNVYEINGRPQLVVKRLHYYDKNQIKYYNFILAEACKIPAIRVLLPFFESDIIEPNVMPKQWQLIECTKDTNGKRLRLPCLVMEKLTAFAAVVRPEEEGDGSNVTEAIADVFWTLENEKFYFMDCKWANLMQRLKPFNRVVLVDIDSLATYHKTFATFSWPQTYPVWKQLKVQNTRVPTELEFQATCKYMTAVAFACTIIDWHARTSPLMYNWLEAMQPANHTKYYYIRKFLENPLDDEVTTQLFLYEGFLEYRRRNPNVFGQQPIPTPAIDTVSSVRHELECVEKSIHSFMRANNQVFKLIIYICSEQCTPFNLPLGYTGTEYQNWIKFGLRASFVDKCH